MARDFRRAGARGGACGGKSLRPLQQDWRTIFNNAGVFQLIGDIDADTLRNMAPDRQIVATSGTKAVNCRLPDYLVDAPFAGLWDPNPMFETDADAPAPHGPGM